MPSCRQIPQQQQKYLIGINNPNQGTRDINRGFIEGLAESGYIEGENTNFIISTSSFELDTAIQDMIARNVDLIFTVTTPAAKRAKQATQGKNIPIVYAMQDPVASGLTKSLAKPDGNLTGVQIRGSVPKTVEWMLSVSPEIKHLFVPIKHDTKAADQSLEDLEKAGSSLGIKLILAEVNDQSELGAALEDIPGEADGIFILHSIFIQSNTDKLVQAAIEKKLLIGSAAAQSDVGVTVSYGMIAEKIGIQVSRLAGLLLSGRSTTDIPSEVADFFLGVNLKTAEASGIEIPATVLQQADIIIR
jgi:putative ABC transport system substrate-binding protein